MPNDAVNTAKLDLDKVPELVGKGSRQRFNDLWSLLVQTNIPLYLVGNSGSSKSITMKNLLKRYSLKAKRPAYYIQLSAEDTKTSVVIGLRLQNGSLVPIDGVLSRAAQQGAIVGIDEITHSTSNMLLMFNALDGGESIISIGDREVYAGDMKVIYGSNRSNHIGNIRIPQSFANRVIGYPFGYMEPEEEAEIAKDAAKRKLLGPGAITLPDSFFKYIASYVKENRTEEWPLSPRNIAHAAVLCQLEYNRNLKLLSNAGQKPKIDSYFSNGANVESIRRNITERITFGKINDTTDMQSQEILDFLQVVSVIGKDSFVEKIKMAMNYYIDMDGVEIIGDEQRVKIASSII